MKWRAEWNEIDVSRGIKNATATGPLKSATVFIDKDGFYRYYSGDPTKFHDYFSGYSMTLAAAKRDLRQALGVPPFTIFKRVYDDKKENNHATQKELEKADKKFPAVR